MPPKPIGPKQVAAVPRVSARVQAAKDAANLKRAALAAQNRIANKERAEQIATIIYDSVETSIGKYRSEGKMMRGNRDVSVTEQLRSDVRAAVRDWYDSAEGQKFLADYPMKYGQLNEMVDEVVNQAGPELDQEMNASQAPAAPMALAPAAPMAPAADDSMDALAGLMQNTGLGKSGRRRSKKTKKGGKKKKGGSKTRRRRA